MVYSNKNTFVKDIIKNSAPLLFHTVANPTQPQPTSHLLYRSSALHQFPNPPDKL